MKYKVATVKGTFMKKISRMNNKVKIVGKKVLIV